MKLQEFDFELPEELIAQTPSSQRDHSKLLIESDEDQNYKIVDFYNIIDFIENDDLIIFNNSKVINGKLSLVSQAGGTINLNLNKPISENVWSCFARPSKRLKIGDAFSFDGHQVIISNKMEYGEIEVTFCLRNKDIFDFLQEYGEVPLPQYIKRDKKFSVLDEERYQTVYSKEKGSVAAPTAGLHFTTELLDKLQQKGAEIAFVTLHVGGGTFLPVKSENIADHIMHEEWCEISKNTADIINKAKRAGRRIIAVGTTTMRTLESCAENNMVKAGKVKTDIFITPGYKFQIADILITNFHLPKSTLFMLICAFIGIEKAQELYQYAISNKMRFFSYGDSMMLKRKIQ